VSDIIDVLASFFARLYLYGRRSARRRWRNRDENIPGLPVLLGSFPRVEWALASNVGARRFVFHWGLALVKERLDARPRGEEVAVPSTPPA
jgi:hypothetical protein